jgi:hypothetical protein
MNKVQAIVAICLGLAPVISGRAVAQPSSCVPLGFPCDPEQYHFYCTIATNWIEDLDFDNDGTDDFRQGRFESSTGCTGDNWRYSIVDDTAALFAVGGVEMYVFAGGRYSPIVPVGQLIEMEPAPGVDGTWQWNPPGFTESATTLGFGYTLRTISQYPCGQPACDQWPSAGWLAVTNPAYFGFRIPHADGWHLGWMRLEQTGWIQVGLGVWAVVLVTDYAVQPQPNTAIRAGERPRPPLSITLAGGRVRVSWPDGYPGFVLEPSRAVVAGLVTGLEPGLVRPSPCAKMSGDSWFLFKAFQTFARRGQDSRIVLRMATSRWTPAV